MELSRSASYDLVLKNRTKSVRNCGGHGDTQIARVFRNLQRKFFVFCTRRWPQLFWIEKSLEDLRNKGAKDATRNRRKSYQLHGWAAHGCRKIDTRRALGSM